MVWQLPTAAEEREAVEMIILMEKIKAFVCYSTYLLATNVNAEDI